MRVKVADAHEPRIWMPALDPSRKQPLQEPAVLPQQQYPQLQQQQASTSITGTALPAAAAAPVVDERTGKMMMAPARMRPDCQSGAVLRMARATMIPGTPCVSSDMPHPQMPPCSSGSATPTLPGSRPGPPPHPMHVHMQIRTTSSSPAALGRATTGASGSGNGSGRGNAASTTATPFFTTAPTPSSFAMEAMSSRSRGAHEHGRGSHGFDIEVPGLGAAKSTGGGVDAGAMASDPHGCARAPTTAAATTATAVLTGQQLLHHQQLQRHVVGKENCSVNAALANSDSSTRTCAPATSHMAAPPPALAMASSFTPRRMGALDALDHRAMFPTRRPSNDFTATSRWPTSSPVVHNYNVSQTPPQLQTPAQASASPRVYSPHSTNMPFALARLRERSASVTNPAECRPALATMAVPRERRSASFTHAGDLVDLLPKKHDPLAHDLRRAAILASAQEASSTALQDEVDASGKRTFPKKCDFPLCKNSSRSRGFCYSHGGGRRCRVDGCPNGAVSRDLCKRHGGGRRCRIAGCKSSSESGGLCYSHGGGKRCNLPNCTARAKKGGLCGQHQAGTSNDTTPSVSTNGTPKLGPLEAPSAQVVETLLALGHSDPSTGSEDDQDDSDTSDPTHPAHANEATDVGTPTSRGRSLSIASLLN